MDVTRYRKYVCKYGKGWGYVPSIRRDMMEFEMVDEPWEQVCHRVPIIHSKDLPDLQGLPNKKLVSFGLLPKKIKKLWLEGHTYDVGEKSWRGSFWDRPKICIGYRLKNNPSVFRPIFNKKLQLNINLFQKNIKRVVDKRMEKHVYIELLKIKQFPKVIVDIIFKMVY